jgi:hypothetical protein
MKAACRSFHFRKVLFRIRIQAGVLVQEGYDDVPEKARTLRAAATLKTPKGFGFPKPFTIEIEAGGS